MTPPHTVLPSAITRANLIGQFNPEWGIKAAYSFSSASRLDLGKVRSQWSFVNCFFEFKVWILSKVLLDFVKGFVLHIEDFTLMWTLQC